MVATRLVYEYEIPAEGPAICKIDNSVIAPKGSFNRVGYFVQLLREKSQWVYTEFDAFDNEVQSLGLPKDKVFQCNVENMKISSNEGLIGENLGGGHITFSPYNYIPGDPCQILNEGNYGCMQVRIAGNVIWCYNNHNVVADIGIGNYMYGNKDWTFAFNSSNYARKSIRVFVL